MSSMQKNRYQEMRERHQAEVNDFPLMFAFDARQFAEGLCRLGLRSSDKDKVCALPGTGGFCRKSDLPALKGMFARHHRELQEATGADPTAGDSSTRCSVRNFPTTNMPTHGTCRRRWTALASHSRCWKLCRSSKPAWRWRADRF